LGGDASERAGISRRAAGGRLAERLVDRRTDGRADLGVAVRGLETVDLGLAVVAFGFAAVDFALVEVRRLAARLGLDVEEAMEFDAARGRGALLDVLVLDALVLDVLVRDLLVEDLVDLGLAVDVRAVVDRRAAGRRAELRRRAEVVLRRAELVLRRAVAPASGFAVDMVLAAAVSAFAAVIIDLVAVFIACIADDIVLADDVALVAAAVIFVAADVTLVAADDTVLAAVAGVAELLDEDLRVEREAELRVEREAVPRDAELRVDRADVPRVDRDAGFRVVDEAIPAGMAAVWRAAVDLARLTVRALVVFGRLAVPDALRLTDLLLAVLAELRRVAARVVVLTGTDFPPS
jgi:hypothetical protein